MRGYTSREDAVERIENCADLTQLLTLLHPDEQKNWGVNFRSVREIGTIEFRRGCASKYLFKSHRPKEIISRT